MEIRCQAHVVYRAEYQIVLVTRYRYEILENGVEKYLEIKLDEVRKYYPQIEYIERNIQPNHVHMILTFPPADSIPTVVGLIKRNTGRALKEKFDFLKQTYYGRGGIWSVGYFVSTIGLDEQMIRRYVKYQEKEDLGLAKPVI